jgi:hypothetical protein
MNLTNQQPYRKHTKRKRSKENDKDYLEFLRSLPSAYSGRRPCEACHYRTAGNAGISIKPLFSAIPLLHEEHAEQHRIGQFNFFPRSEWEAFVKYYQLLFLRQGGSIPEQYRVDVSA